MPNNIYEALKMDMCACPLQDEIACKLYLRELLSEAYLGKNSKNSNVYNYVRMRGIENVQSEIKQMIYKGDMYLNYASLLDSVTEQIFPEIMQIKNNFIASSKTSSDGVYSFMEVMEKTLTYYSKKGQFNKEDSDAVIKCAHLILSNYFKSNRPSVFSFKNGTRSYVIAKGKEAIFNEIEEELGMERSTLDELITAYALKVSSSFLSKNTGLENSSKIR